MKKFLSLFVVLALVLAMLPVAAFAEDGDTINLSAGDEQYVELFAEGTLNLVVTTGSEPALLTVDGLGMYYDWYIDTGMMIYYPEMVGSYSLELDANTTYNYTLVSDTGFDDQALRISVEEVLLGSELRPADLVMGENVATVDGSAPYFFSWTAAEAGQLTISAVTDKCSDWSFQVNGTRSNGTMRYGDTFYSDVDPVVSSDTAIVYPGDVYMVMVNTAEMGNAGTIYINASFTPGIPEGGEGEGEGEGGDIIVGGLIEEGTVFVKSETGNESENRKFVEFIAPADGTVYITMSSPDKGWSLMVHKNGEALTWKMTSSLEQIHEYPVLAGDVLMFEMGAYDAVVAWGDADANITYSISFEPGEVVIEKDLYEVSDTQLYEGDNDLTMIDSAENTLFEFTPTETGIYTFTAPAGILIGNWGQVFNPMDNSGEAKTNTLQWTCTDVGQSILVGVIGEEDIVLNVERTGDYVPAPVVGWTEFEITAELDYFELDPDVEIVAVNVTDKKPDKAVLGEDGFYHLNRADGPILYVDLNKYVYPATGYGNVGYITYDEHGNVVEKINYTNAVIEYYEYSDGGLYPLTADLMEIYQNYGKNQGWYNAEGNGFYLFTGSTVDPETAWMFACYYDVDGYVEPEEPENPEDPTDPSDPEDPTDPSEPEDPTDPSEPEDPADPSEPEDPEEPTPGMSDLPVVAIVVIVVAAVSAVVLLMMISA